MFGADNNQDSQNIPTMPLGQPSAFDQQAQASSPMTNPISNDQHSGDYAPMVASTAPAPAMPMAGDDDLADIKQNALQNLTPLVDRLDQQPEERFKTLMMLIQASDNSSLIKQAYQAANQIPDQKIKAQALIDIVNEINYFTQQKSGKS